MGHEGEAAKQPIDVKCESSAPSDLQCGGICTEEAPCRAADSTALNAPHSIHPAGEDGEAFKIRTRGRNRPLLDQALLHQ